MIYKSKLMYMFYMMMDIEKKRRQEKEKGWERGKRGGDEDGIGLLKGS